MKLLPIEQEIHQATVSRFSTSLGIGVLPVCFKYLDSTHQRHELLIYQFTDNIPEKTLSRIYEHLIKHGKLLKHGKTTFSFLPAIKVILNFPYDNSILDAHLVRQPNGGVVMINAFTHSCRPINTFDNQYDVTATIIGFSGSVKLKGYHLSDSYDLLFTDNQPIASLDRHGVSI